MSDTSSPPESHADSDIELDEADVKAVQGQIWTPMELAILKQSIQPYRALPSEEKAAWIMKEIVMRFKKLDAKKYGSKAMKKGGQQYEAWKKKKTRIFDWMMTHGRVKKQIKLPGLYRRNTFHTVMKELHREAIKEEARRLAGPDSNSRDWIKHYQAARRTIQEALTEEEIEEIEKKVTEWNNGSLPPAMQQENAKKNFNKVLAEVNRRNFLTMGARSITLAFYIDEKDRIVYTMLDTESLNLDSPRVPSFKAYNPKALEAIEVAYKRYVKHVREILQDEISTTMPAEVDPTQLTYHPGGLPIVPPAAENVHGNETNKMQQLIIRTYINKHYELASGKKNGKAPYKKIATNPDLYLATGSWPTDVIFDEPGKFGADDSRKILKHWRTRQQEGAIPFRFDNVPIGTHTEPAAYPAEMFDMANLRATPLAPLPRRAKPAKRATFRDHSEPPDSEDHPSEEDDAIESQDEEEAATSPPPSSIGHGPPASSIGHTLPASSIGHTPPASSIGRTLPASTADNSSNGWPSSAKKIFERGNRRVPSTYSQSNDEGTAPPSSEYSSDTSAPPTPIPRYKGKSRQVQVSMPIISEEEDSEPQEQDTSHLPPKASRKPAGRGRKPVAAPEESPVGVTAAPAVENARLPVVDTLSNQPAAKACARPTAEGSTRPPAGAKPEVRAKAPKPVASSSKSPAEPTGLVTRARAAQNTPATRSKATKTSRK